MKYKGNTKEIQSSRLHSVCTVAYSAHQKLSPLGYYLLCGLGLESIVTTTAIDLPFSTKTITLHMTTSVHYKHLALCLES